MASALALGAFVALARLRTQVIPTLLAGAVIGVAYSLAVRA